MLKSWLSNVVIKHNRKTVAVNLGGGIGLVLDERFVLFVLLCLFDCLGRISCLSAHAPDQGSMVGRLAVFNMRTWVPLGRV